MKLLTKKELEERREIWAKKNARQAFQEKTPWDQLPFQYGFGSSTHYPGRRAGITTCDIVEWIYFWDTWFRPYGRFSANQIKEMHDVCINDNQVQALFEMLNCKIG